ncbi:hypothetical protein RHODGE_RHODGE_01226 [Rhodoplanes serenus]|uniref:Uncharacterized protein n=1 Tax=Rhodoplanes serenus TaxID=200615 RepID=A0A3S4AZP3_9BRAD|nr:class I SAM-dependent methyltransferase [Rhodoplanes serenus]VCU08091.1 hypothetical protein RHODGE_RHODGE_01226 [Rhodoplanes serenus]
MPANAPSAAADFSSWQDSVFGEVAVVARTCPHCGDDNAATAPGPYSLGRWTVKTCAGCGLTYTTSGPVYEALSEQMSWEKTSQLESEWRDATRTTQQKLSRATRWRLHLLPRKSSAALIAAHAAPGNVVDLGCGHGRSYETLAPGYVPYGIEVSAAAAAEARTRFARRGGDVVAAPCLAGLRGFPDGFFTAATLQSYLEHESHPVAVLREIHRTLAADGVAIVKVPNYGSLNRRVMGRRWCGFRLPDHQNYFTPKTLRAMAETCGFRTSFGPTWRLPTSDNMWALLRRV